MKSMVMCWGESPLAEFQHVSGRRSVRLFFPKDLGSLFRVDDTFMEGLGMLGGWVGLRDVGDVIVD